MAGISVPTECRQTSRSDTCRVDRDRDAPTLVLGYYSGAIAWYFASRQGLLRNVRGRDESRVALRFNISVYKWLIVPIM